MGGRGSSGGKSSGGAGGSRVTSSDVTRAAEDFLKHNMSIGTQSVSLENASIVGGVGEDGYANVKMEYSTRVQVAVGYDAELRQMEYETETEYHTDTFRIKVK